MGKNGGIYGKNIQGNIVKTAIITGVSGQDGAYLAELLLKKNYVVIGTLRGYRNINYKNFEYLGQSAIIRLYNFKNLIIKRI